MVAQFKDPILNAEAHIRRANEFDPDYWLVRKERIHESESPHFSFVGYDNMCNPIYEFEDVYCNYQDLRWLKFGEYYYPCGMNKFHLLPENWEEE